MKLLKIILIPLVPIYSAAVLIRNWLFDKNIFKRKKVRANIISVGNITTGGSGKTPLVIYLLNLLKKEGKKVGVLSRGYGRKSKGYILVSNGSELLTTVDQCGDEIYHTISESNVPGAVCESRVNGAKKLIADSDVDTIVLDDAFQHRWISREIDLVIWEQRYLIDPEFLNYYLLPAGKMREPFTSLGRADALILNRKFSPSRDVPGFLKKYFKDKIIFKAFYKAIGFVDIARKTEYGLEEFRGQKSLVVSGIANPHSFLNILKQTNVDIENTMIFRDHKNYTLKEVQRIRKKFYTTNSHSVVTTQKDAVKLLKFSKELDDIDIFYLKIELALDDETSFKNFILNNLN
jgi:tetraacyldisaccharide 4'-kinase